MSTILIVEDEIKILRILDKIVKSAEYKTLLAKNGSEALQITRESHPDMILTDINMPIMSGLELCKSLKNDKQTSSTGIIIITASSEAPDLLKIFKYGANAWIKKPFQRAEVLEKIETVRMEMELMHKTEIIGNWINFKLASTTEILTSVNAFIENLLSHSVMEVKEARQFGFAINEMLLNSIEHGNQFIINKNIHLSYVLFKNKVIIKIQDEGKGFLVSQIPNPLNDPLFSALQRENEGKRPGGYGIAVTRQYVDKVEYNDKGNILLLTKYI